MCEYPRCTNGGRLHIDAYHVVMPQTIRQASFSRRHEQDLALFALVDRREPSQPHVELIGYEDWYIGVLTVPWTWVE